MLSVYPTAITDSNANIELNASPNPTVQLCAVIGRQTGKTGQTNRLLPFVLVDVWNVF